MGAGIEATDNLVMHKEGGWHGLGIVVEDAPTPREALKIIGADYAIEQKPLVAMMDEKTGRRVSTHVGNYRADNWELMGVVGKGYQVVQNLELAEFCEALAEQGDVVRVETAGTLNGGRKIWMLLKGESFTVRGTEDDEIVPYYAIFNGHDGSTGIKGSPTKIRVVCKNTMEMVIGTREKPKKAAFSFNHTKNIKKRVEEARAALGLYQRAQKVTRECIDALAAKDVNSEMVQSFLLSCYVRDHGAIPTNPTNTKEHNALFKARHSIAAMLQRFEFESSICGTTMWTAYNAYTGWLQNDVMPNCKDPDKAWEQKTASKLWGADLKRSGEAFRSALTLAG